MAVFALYMAPSPNPRINAPSWFDGWSGPQVDSLAERE